MDLSYKKTSSPTMNVTTESNRTFELGVQSGIKVPFYIIVGFKHRDQFNQHQRSNDTTWSPTVVSAQCIIGSANYPNAGLISN